MVAQHVSRRNKKMRILTVSRGGAEDKAGEEEDEDGEGEQRSTEVGASARVFTLLMQLRDLPGWNSPPPAGYKHANHELFT